MRAHKAKLPLHFLVVLKDPIDRVGLRSANNEQCHNDLRPSKEMPMKRRQDKYKGQAKNNRQYCRH